MSANILMNKNDLCFCGSKKSYRSCHRDEIRVWESRYRPLGFPGNWTPEEREKARKTTDGRFLFEKYVEANSKHSNLPLGTALRLQCEQYASTVFKEGWKSWIGCEVAPIIGEIVSPDFRTGLFRFRYDRLYVVDTSAFHTFTLGSDGQTDERLQLEILSAKGVRMYSCNLGIRSGDIEYRFLGTIFGGLGTYWAAVAIDSRNYEVSGRIHLSETGPSITMYSSEGLPSELVEEVTTLSLQLYKCAKGKCRRTQIEEVIHEFP